MATKRKTKRFDGETGSEVGRGYEDSNAGMDEVAAEVATSKAVKEATPDAAVELEKLPARVAPAARAARADIVTPAQMKAAGFDNLRDYLNDKQGLTRRGSPAVEKTVTAAPATPMAKPVKMSREESIAQIPTSSRLYSTVGGQSASGSELGRNLSAALMGQGSGLATLGKIGAEAMMAKGVANRASASKAAKEIAERSARVATRRKAAGAKEALRRDATFEGGMARGGSVSAASRRADGIATKGKTRGKVC